MTPREALENVGETVALMTTEGYLLWPITEALTVLEAELGRVEELRSALDEIASTDDPEGSSHAARDLRGVLQIARQALKEKSA